MRDSLNSKDSSREGKDFEKELWAAAERFRGEVPVPEFQELVLGLVLLRHVCRTFESHRSFLDAAVRNPTSNHYLPTERERQVALNKAHTYRSAGGFFVPLFATWQRIETAAVQRPDRLARLLDVAMGAVERENDEFNELLPKHYGTSGLDSNALSGLVRVVSELCDRQQPGGPMALAQLTRNFAGTFGGARAGGGQRNQEPQGVKAGEVIARFDEKLSKFDTVLKELRDQLRHRKP